MDFFCAIYLYSDHVLTQMTAFTPVQCVFLLVVDITYFRLRNVSSISHAVDSCKNPSNQSFFVLLDTQYSKGSFIIAFNCDCLHIAISVFCSDAQIASVLFLISVA